MPAPSKNNQIGQWGAEATEGTIAAGFKQFLSLSHEINIEGTHNTVRPDGYKPPTDVQPLQEWSSFTFNGPVDYQALAAIFDGILKKANPVTASGATTRTYDPSSTAVDTVQSYSLEKGTSARGKRTLGNRITDLSLTFSRTQAQVQGGGMGRLMAEGASTTLTAGATVVPSVLINPGKIDLYIDATQAALGTTKFLKAYKYVLSIGGRQETDWPMNSANPSFDEFVEGIPNMSLSLDLAADAQGMGLLPFQRDGTTRWVRLKAPGAVIGAGPATYDLVIDTPVKINSVFKYGGDTGPVYGGTWGLTLVHDATWGKYINVSLVNTLATV